MGTPQTLDQLLAGFQPNAFFDKAVSPTLVTGRSFSTWYQAGIPCPGTTDTSTGTGVVLTNPTAGQIPVPAIGGGQDNWLTSLCGWTSTVQGNLVIADRLLTCGATTAPAAISITSNAAQTLNTQALPARDINFSTNGVGVFAALEVVTSFASNTAAPTITISYTDPVNGAGRSGTNIFATATNPPQGTFWPISLQAGDTGVKSVQSITFSASWVGTGTCAVVLYKVLAVIPVIVAYSPTKPLNVGTGLLQKITGAVPFVIIEPGNTTATFVSGLFGTSLV